MACRFPAGAGNLRALTLAALHAIASVDARPEFTALIPNGAAIVGVQALGHVDQAGGGQLNAFGKAFQASGFKWTHTLCHEDSDGDGRTNGQELGDPCCVWNLGGGVPTFTTGATDPGDPRQAVNETLLYQWVCGASTAGSVEDGAGANPSPGSQFGSNEGTSSTTNDTPSVTAPTPTPPPPMTSSTHTAMAAAANLVVFLSFCTLLSLIH